MIFRDAVSEYMSAKARTLRPTTMEGYRSALRAHVLPAFGGRELEGIGHEEVQAWADSFERPGAARKAFKTFRQVYRWALRRHGLRVWDVTQGVELPRVRRAAPKALPARDLKRLLLMARGQEWEAVVACQAALGLRRSEACGLRWGDVDLGSGLVRVERGAHTIGGETVCLPPKTARSARTLVLPAWAVARLREVKRAARPKKADPLCAIGPDAMAKRFRRWALAHGVDATTMRLRHTWATLALTAGVRIEVVAMMLGHEGVETCYSHYLAASEDVFRRAQRATGRALLKA